MTSSFPLTTQWCDLGLTEDGSCIRTALAYKERGFGVRQSSARIPLQVDKAKYATAGDEMAAKEPMITDTSAPPRGTPGAPPLRQSASLNLDGSTA